MPYIKDVSRLLGGAAVTTFQDQQTNAIEEIIANEVLSHTTGIVANVNDPDGRWGCDSWLLSCSSRLHGGWKMAYKEDCKTI